jgi:hypothetical protein
MEGMTPRQQDFFLQNWKPASINDIQRVSVHQQQQVRAAESQTNNALVDQAAQEYVDTGEELSLHALSASIDAVAKSEGWTPEATASAKEEASQSAVSSRVDALVASNDFDGAEEALAATEVLSDTQKNVSQVNIDNARRTAANRLRSEASARLTESQLDENIYLIESENKLAVPPLENYREWFGPKLGIVKHANRVAEVAKLQQGVDVLEARSTLFARAGDIYAQLANGAADPSDARALINDLEIDGSAAAKAMSSMLVDAHKSYSIDSPDALTVKDATIINRAIADFNDINDKGGWGNTFKGTVEADATGVATSGDSNTAATRAFSDLIAGWSQYKREAAADKKGALTLKDLSRLQTEYFEPLWIFKGRKDFRDKVSNPRLYSPGDPRKRMFNDNTEELNRIESFQAQLLEQLNARNNGVQ